MLAKETDRKTCEDKYNKYDNDKYALYLQKSNQFEDSIAKLHQVAQGMQKQRTVYRDT